MSENIKPTKFTIQDIEAQITAIEGFEVIIRAPSNVTVPMYNYQKGMVRDRTVSGWVNTRFKAWLESWMGEVKNAGKYVVVFDGCRNVMIGNAKIATAISRRRAELQGVKISGNAARKKLSTKVDLQEQA